MDDSQWTRTAKPLSTAWIMFTATVGAVLGVLMALVLIGPTP